MHNTEKDYVGSAIFHLLCNSFFPVRSFSSQYFSELAFHESTEIPEMESEENTTRVQASLGGKQTYRTGAK
jgi:hypothetical protein